MKLLNDKFDLNSFFENLTAAEKPLLMLDYDGTLSPFTTDRENAYPYRELIPALERLFSAEKTRVVIISGRSIESLKNLLEFDQLPELWGCHGLERLTRDGEHSVMPLEDAVNERLSELYPWISQNGLIDISEFKPSGAAFHWRGLPENQISEIKDKVLNRWQGEVENSGLEIHNFDGGVEIRVAGTNKSTPVKTLLEEADNNFPAAYLGDDFTDEDAFGTLKGRGLSVLVRPEIRDTAADLWLKPPSELTDFFARWP